MSITDDIRDFVLKQRPDLDKTQEQQRIESTILFFVCPSCSIKQDVLNFCSSTGTRYPYCRTCRNEWQTLRKHYALIHPQPECCELCKLPFGVGGLRPDIDHAHDETKAFRGWLHSNCNKALGMFKTSVEHLEQAIAYVKRFE
jgi:Recombination endonuclease VII